MEAEEFENLISAEGGIFEGTQQWAKVNVLCTSQGPLAGSR